VSTRGAFITFEGGEGSGKSTQIARLAKRLTAAGLTVRVLREPGGTRVGEGVRALLLDPEHTDLDPTAELLLYEASRAQLVADVIQPALAAGEIVLCDRFYDSTTAYQGFARGLPLDRIRELNEIATLGIKPDRTIVLDVEPAMGIERATRYGTDRLEGENEAFHTAVRHGFLAIAAEEPGRVRVIDADTRPNLVAERVSAALVDLPALTKALS
jgi:dTMP kinase